MDTNPWADIGDRVRESRLAAALSQEQLGELVGLERTKIAKIEAGARQINAVELTRFAAALNVPLGHFLHARPALISRRVPLVDDTNSSAARASYRIDAELAAWLRDVREVAALGSWTPSPLLRYPNPAATADEARIAAAWARQQLRLGSGPIDTMMAVCEAAGQLVLVVDVPGDGASLVEDDVAVAVVSKAPDPGRRRATAAHELGHLILGDEYSSDLGGGVASSRRDREAVIDAFAAEFLLPAGTIPPTASTRDDLRAALISTAARYRTSWTLAVRQAVVANLIAQSDERWWLSAPKPTRAELMQAVGWAPQPDLERVAVPPGYADAVITAWRDSLVAASRAVELMHGQITAEDLGAADDGPDEP